MTGALRSPKAPKREPKSFLVEPRFLGLEESPKSKALDLPTAEAISRLVRGSRRAFESFLVVLDVRGTKVSPRAILRASGVVLLRGDQALAKGRQLGVSTRMPTSILSGDLSGNWVISGSSSSHGKPKSVATKRDLFAISAYDREEGMLILVRDEKLLCTLLGGITNDCWMFTKVDFEPLPPPVDPIPSRFEREIE